MQEKDDSRVVTQDYGCIIRNLEKKKGIMPHSFRLSDLRNNYVIFQSPSGMFLIQRELLHISSWSKLYGDVASGELTEITLSQITRSSSCTVLFFLSQLESRSFWLIL